MLNKSLVVFGHFNAKFLHFISFFVCKTKMSTSSALDENGPKEFLVWLMATAHIKRIRGARQRLALLPHNHTVETLTCQQ